MHWGLHTPARVLTGCASGGMLGIGPCDGGRKRSGSRLGPYEIGTPLGAGGMGEVYRARDIRLNRDVAILNWYEELKQRVSIP